MVDIEEIDWKLKEKMFRNKILCASNEPLTYLPNGICGRYTQKNSSEL